MKIKCSHRSKLIPENESDTCENYGKFFYNGCLTYHRENSEMAFYAKCESKYWSKHFDQFNLPNLDFPLLW
jgi:hypothetical protein